MFVNELGSKISARLVAVAATDTVQAAAIAFADPGVGLIVVCDPGGGAVGVVSKSDLVRHLAAAGPVETPAAAIMSCEIVCCALGDDLYAAWEVMSARRLQSLPVLDIGSKPIGVLDIRDALAALFDEEQYQERLLESYVAGVGYR